MKQHTHFGWKGLLAGVAALASLAGTAPASALDLAGKRVTLIVPYQEGSGSTIHGRLFAMALERTLPGNPTIIVRNIDGGGSVRGINQFYKDARPDGMMIAAIATGTFFQYILKDSAVAYPLPKFKPFVTSPFGLLAYARTDLGLRKDDYVENIRKLIAKPPVYGGSGATSSDLPALLSFDLLGIRQKNVFGLSNAESRAGFERGEFSLKYDNAASWAEEVKPLVDEGTATPLFTFGLEVDGKIVRDPTLPDVPTFLEVYEKINGKPLAGIEFAVWKALFNVRVMGSKMLVLPPDTPQDIVDVYTKAAAEALRSDILTGPQAKLVLGAYPQSVGAASEAVFKAGLDMTPEQQKWLRDWLKQRFEITVAD